MTAPGRCDRMRVEMLCVDGCPNCEALRGRVEALLVRRGHRARVELRAVSSIDEAVALRFLGSPTLRVNGRDVEPGADVRTDYGLGCRLYWSGDTAYGRPSDALVLRALQDESSAMSSGADTGSGW